MIRKTDDIKALQDGLALGRATTDSIFITRQLQENGGELLNFVYVNLQKVFDTT